MMGEKEALFCIVEEAGIATGVNDLTQIFVAVDCLIYTFFTN
jgi:hypothetical protein